MKQYNVDLKLILKNNANYTHEDFGLVAKFIQNLSDNGTGIIVCDESEVQEIKLK